MDVTPLIRSDQQVIQSYSTGRFKISGQVYETPMLVYPGEALVWDAPMSVNALEDKAFQPLIDNRQEIDVVLFGSGRKMAFLPEPLRRELTQNGLSVESMGTGAACRTYNVLMAEGRRVVAALLPV